MFQKMSSAIEQDFVGADVDAPMDFPALLEGDDEADGPDPTAAGGLLGDEHALSGEGGSVGRYFGVQSLPPPLPRAAPIP